MAVDIEKKKAELKLKKSRLEAQEKLLKLKERKKRTRLLIEIGGLASKAGIDHLNTNTLLGAFLEIKERIEKNKKEWTQKGAEAFEIDQAKNGMAVIVAFPSEPDRETKSLIRAAGLKWNRFRKEWQGRAVQSELEKILKDQEHTMEVLDEEL